MIICLPGCDSNYDFQIENKGFFCRKDDEFVLVSDLVSHNYAEFNEIWTKSRFCSYLWLSSNGDVFSESRSVSPRLSDGYFVISYYRDEDSQRVARTVHRELFTAFYPELNLNGMDVHHIDENKTNNHIWNLQMIEHGQHSKYHDSIRYQDPLYIQRLSDIQKEVQNRPEVKEKAKIGQQKFLTDPSTAQRREEIRQINIKSHSTDHYKETIKKLHADPDFKARFSKSRVQGHKTSKEYGAKLKEQFLDPASALFQENSLDGEIWKDVPGYTIYLASNFGRLATFATGLKFRNLENTKYIYLCESEKHEYVQKEAFFKNLFPK